MSTEKKIDTAAVLKRLADRPARSIAGVAQAAEAQPNAVPEREAEQQAAPAQKTKPFNLRLTESQHTDLKSRAAQERRSIRDVMVQLLVQHGYIKPE